MELDDLELEMLKELVPYKILAPTPLEITCYIKDLNRENERLENDLQTALDICNNRQKEIVRLNNIINELEKDIEEYFKKEYPDRKLEDCDLQYCTYDYVLVILGKLKELKEGK